GDLQKTGRVALTELTLAEINGRRVVGVDGNPRIDLGRIRWASDLTARGPGGRRATADLESDNERATGLEKVAPGKRHLAARRHRASPAIRPPASWIACITRG